MEDAGTVEINIEGAKILVDLGGIAGDAIEEGVKILQERNLTWKKLKKRFRIRKIFRWCFGKCKDNTDIEISESDDNKSENKMITVQLTK